MAVPTRHALSLAPVLAFASLVWGCDSEDGADKAAASTPAATPMARADAEAKTSDPVPAPTGLPATTPKPEPASAPGPEHSWGPLAAGSVPSGIYKITSRLAAEPGCKDSDLKDASGDEKDKFFFTLEVSNPFGLHARLMSCGDLEACRGLVRETRSSGKPPSQFSSRTFNFSEQSSSKPSLVRGRSSSGGMSSDDGLRCEDGRYEESTIGPIDGDPKRLRIEHREHTFTYAHSEKDEDDQDGLCWNGFVTRDGPNRACTRRYSFEIELVEPG